MAQRLTGRPGTPGRGIFTSPEQVRSHPEDAVAALLQVGIYGLTAAEVRSKSRTLTVIWITLEPWAPMAAEGYPTERVSICVWDDDTVSAIPHQAQGHTWVHRNPDSLPVSSHGPRGEWGTLCLWYPGDPRGLRWEWPDGLDQYVTMVHRHLQAEEYARRHGAWPAEDAPHGSGPHPILSPAVREAVDRWRPAC